MIWGGLPTLRDGGALLSLPVVGPGRMTTQAFSRPFGGDKEKGRLLNPEAIFDLVVAQQESSDSHGKPECNQPRVLVLLSFFIDRGKER